MAGFSLELTEDQVTLQKWLHEFSVNVIRPAASEWDEREETPWPIIQEAAKAGIYSLDFFANAWGDESGISLPLCLEELFWGDAGIGLSIVGSTLGVAGILSNGTPEQLMEWAPQCFGTPDDIKLCALAVSEPNAGSDVSSMKTTAVYDEKTDEWVLNGVKTWITNGGIADVHVVVASVDLELKARGQASFVVGPDSKANGSLRQGQKFKKHGIRASHTSEVILDNCRIPGNQLLGGKEKLDARLAKARERAAALARGESATSVREKGGQAAMATFEASRPTVGAQALGIARAAYEYSLDYAKEREQFGKKIIENQSIAFTLARMKMEIDAARLLVWRASWMGRNQVPFENAEGSMSKLKSGEVAVWATERAIQILGGNGYTREFPVERWHRDAKIYDIFEGTAEIQQLVIARAISGAKIR